MIYQRTAPTSDDQTLVGLDGCNVILHFNFSLVAPPIECSSGAGKMEGGPGEICPVVVYLYLTLMEE